MPKSTSVQREKLLRDIAIAPRKLNSRNQKRLCDSHATQQSMPTEKAM